MKKNLLLLGVILWLSPLSLLAGSGNPGGFLVTYTKGYLQNGNGTFCAGDPVTFTLVTDGKDPQVVQWQYKRSDDGIVWILRNSDGSIYKGLSCALKIDKNIQMEIAVHYDSEGTTYASAVGYMNFTSDKSTPGVISSDQYVAPTSVPAPLIGTNAEVPGKGKVVYTWEKSINQSTWKAIDNSNNASYTPTPTSLTTYYRRIIRNVAGGCTAASNAVKIEIANVTINGDEGQYCVGTSATPLELSIQTSKDPEVQWEKNKNNTEWITIDGAVSRTYTPIEINYGTYQYRAKVSWDSGTQVVYSNSKKEVFHPLISGFRVTPTRQMVIQSETPAALVLRGATGEGTYHYQWETQSLSTSVPNNNGWNNIVNAIDTIYQARARETGNYRAVVSSGTCVNRSNIVTIEEEPLKAGTIGHNATVGLHGRHQPLIEVMVSNGRAFKWERKSTLDTRWQVVQDWGTVRSYSPTTFLSGVDGTIYYYRRWARINPTESVVSNEVKISMSAVDPGSIIMANPRTTITRYDTIGWMIEELPYYSSSGTQKRFRWQMKQGEATWTNLTDWGDSLTSKNYHDVTPLTSPGQYNYRRVFVQDKNNQGNESEYRYSNELSVVVEDLKAGEIILIDSIIALNATPAKLTNVMPGNGHYYQWQYRETVDGTWSNLTTWESSNEEYTPISPMSGPFRQYRRLSKTLLSTSDDLSQSSNIITVRVQIIDPGFITLSQSVITRGGKAELVNVERGEGTVFRWQVSRKNTEGRWGAWSTLGTDIFASNKLGAKDEHVTQISKYRRLAKESIGQNDLWMVYSNEVEVSLDSLKGGVIGNNQRILKNGVPVKFIDIVSGNGQAYQWLRKREGDANFLPITEFSTRGMEYQEIEPVSNITYYKRIVKPLLSSEIIDTAESNIIKIEPLINLIPGIVALSSSGETDTIVDSGTVLSTFYSVYQGNATSFKWQKKLNNKWTDLTNWGNHITYKDVTPVIETSIYRRCAKAHRSTADDQTFYSNEITVTINNSTGGKIAGDTTITAGDLPGRFRNIQEGDGNLYQWQKNTNNRWEEVTGWSSENKEYEAPALLRTAFYRRVNKAEGNDAAIASSNVIKVEVKGLEVRDETITATDFYLSLDEVDFGLTDDQLIRRSGAEAINNVTLLPVEITTPITHNIVAVVGSYRATFSTGKGTSKTVKVYVVDDNYIWTDSTILFAHDFRLYLTEVTSVTAVTDNLLLSRAEARGYNSNTQLPVDVMVQDRTMLDDAIVLTPGTTGVYPITFGYMGVTINTNVTIVSGDTVTISFDVNFDDTKLQNRLEPQKVLQGEFYGHLPVPVRLGTTFLYWSLDTDGLTPIDTATIIGSLEGTDVDHTLYAIWKYSVSLDLQGGQGDTSLLVQQFRPYQYFQPLPIPLRKGYRFIGWALDAEGTTTIDGTMIVDNKNEHTLYAIWEARKITVIFDAKGGMVTPQKITVTFNAHYGELPVPEKGNDRFINWCMADGKPITGTDIVDTVAIEIILYAKYQIYKKSGTDRYVITPNNDGLNDRFYLQFLWADHENDITAVQVSIYDRKGYLVYTLSNYQEQDGDFDGGNLSDGTYIVSVHYLDKGEKKEYNPTITIIR